MGVVAPGEKKSLTMPNLLIKLYHIYVCYTNITLYHVIYSVRYYPRFHLTAVGLGTYYPLIGFALYRLQRLLFRLNFMYSIANFVTCVQASINL